MTQRTQCEFAGVQTDPSQIDPRKTDRRRRARYSCSGQAQIACLPLNGTLLRGSLRDLGLGGCRIESFETTAPFDLRARTEILVKVNSWFFRAMAHVRAVRGQPAISVEFMCTSAGWIQHACRAHRRPEEATTRGDPQQTSPRAFLFARTRPEAESQHRYRRTIVPAESADSALAASREA
jgi:hypothetical protein